MLWMWISYGFIILVSYLFFLVVYFRARHHYGKYPLSNSAKHTTYGFRPKKWVFPLYFILLTAVTIFFGVFLYFFT